MLRFPLCLAATLVMAFALLSAGEAAGPEGGQIVSLPELGATAKGSGQKFNKDWPPNNALVAGMGRGGTVFGGPLKGGRVDITLIIPLDIVAIEVVPLDYGGTVQPKAIDIFVDGKLVKQAALPETPGQPIRIPLAAKGQVVGILVTDEYPIITQADGSKGANWGGWARLRVLSSTDLAKLMRPVDDWKAERRDSGIAPTNGAAVSGKVEVVGEPRQSTGHPCTLWDNEDIAHYQAMLKTSADLRTQFAGLKLAMDQRLTQPVGVPAPRKGADGAWQHISDAEPLPGGKNAGDLHNQLSLDLANLGTVYVLTGDATYAEFAKRILLAYADAYPNYAIGARHGFNHSPSKAFDQILGDATWAIPVARGYDLIYNLPSITPDERQRIERGFLGEIAKLICSNGAMYQASTNWAAIGTCAILTIGYAIDDKELINTAFWGQGGSKEKNNGGLFDRHFGPAAITADGLWVEGAMGYQFMALQALIADAEILWHHGIDLYRYRDCALKRLFDTPQQFSYPNLFTPAIHDAGYESIIGMDSYLYEYAYRRYRDPAHLMILNQTGRHLAATFQQFAVSVLYDRDTVEKAPLVEWKNVNFFGVGYGVLRQTNAAGTNNLLLDYGPAGSHGHPDKLSIDLYAFNDRLIPDPGSVWYEQPIYVQWYHTTLAHNTILVDEQSQNMANATQIIYGPATTLGMQRAWSTEACPGVTLDRAVFLTPDYLADLFGAFGRLPRTVDLAWHILGEFSSPLTLTEKPFPAPVEMGYCALSKVRRASTDQAWNASLARKGNVARFFAAGGNPTEVIVGEGVLDVESPPTILQRRKTASTLYGNAVDISGAKDGYVKAVRQEGGLEAGYGLLEVQTARGSDTCFSAFRPGTWKVGGVETDAQQAFVLRDGQTVRALYLGSGSTLASNGVVLRRSEPGLACLERLDNGSFVLANPSADAATLSILHPALAGMQAYALDSQGRRGAVVTVTSGKDKALQVALKGSSQVEFALAGVASMFDIRQAVLAKRQVEQEAAFAKARNDCLARTATSESAAKAKPLPGNTIVVLNATRFSGQGGGAVQIAASKRAAIGKAFSHWNDLGQWLEWKLTVPAEGYYNLSVCYCSQDDLAVRTVTINGEVQEPFAPMRLPGTGGWANGSDDWRLGTAMNPVNDKPLLLKLKAGENLLRLTNHNGRGANLNYLALTSPDVVVTRELLGAKVPAEAP